MARPNITFPDIGLRARERVDMVNSSFISATEEESLIETAWKEFFMTILARHEDIFLRRTQVSTSAGSSQVLMSSLPTADFIKVRGIQHIESNRPDVFLRKIDVREEPLVTDGRNGKPTSYSIHAYPGSEPYISLYPTPDRVYPLQVTYIPFTSLRDALAGGGTMYFIAGWDQYIVTSVAIMMRDKEEGDCSVLLLEKQQQLELILKSLTPFDEGEPAAVVQSRAGLSIYDDPFAIEDRLGF